MQSQITVFFQKPRKSGWFACRVQVKGQCVKSIEVCMPIDMKDAGKGYLKMSTRKMIWLKGVPASMRTAKVALSP